MQNVSLRAFELNGKGESLAAEGKLDEALAVFNEAVLASPGYAGAWLNRADVLEKLGRVDEAEADREAARSLTAALQAQLYSQLYSVPEAQDEPAREWVTAAPPRIQLENDSVDVVGPGRYFLNFSLAGSYAFARFIDAFPSGWYDVVGPEWYILTFCMTFFPVGFVALWYTHLLRNHG
jgi:tetratricopeptide (TPR) repeat protein